jgi:hypothetical protein
LENVERLMREENMRPFEAALEAMDEVSGAVVAIVLVLCAVFIPVAFLGGIAGQLYRQFAVTLSFAVVISGFIALTLTPALCAILMKRGDHHSRLFAPFNRGFAWTTQRFLGGVQRLLRHPVLSLVAFVLLLGVCIFLFLRVPSSFVPAEDQGYIFGNIQLPDGATLERTRSMTAEVGKPAANPGANVLEDRRFDLLGGATRPMPPPCSSRSRTGRAPENSAHASDGAHGGRAKAWCSLQPGRDPRPGHGGFEPVARADPDPAPVPGHAVLPRALRRTRSHRRELVLPPDGAAAARRSTARRPFLGVPEMSSPRRAPWLRCSERLHKFAHYRVQMQADASYRRSPRTWAP